MKDGRGVSSDRPSIKKWTMSMRKWKLALNRFIIEFGDRLDGHFREWVAHRVIYRLLAVLLEALSRTKFGPHEALGLVAMFLPNHCSVFYPPVVTSST